MSKIGKKPTIIPEGVEVKLNDGVFDVKGPKGSLQVKLLAYINVDMKKGEIILSTKNNIKQARSNWGTMASLLTNAIEGVKDGYEKILEVEGVGFRVSMEGVNLILNVGFSHPVKFETPEGIALSTEKNTIKVTGIDKALVGVTAAKIRKIKKPEPYKGKGIRYQGEVIRRKAGKKVAGTAAAA